MRTAIVTPTYNEAENITPLVEGIHQAYPGMDVIVVDDGSPDGTGRIAAGLPRVHVIQRTGKLGLGTAYVEGFTYALAQGYERIGGMDADLSHDPKVLPALFGLLDTYDVGVGARYVPGGGTKNWGIHRKILSGGSNLLARFLLHVPAHDITSGYRSYRREVLEKIDLKSMKSDGYAFLVEILYRAVLNGFTVGETPILFADRERGQSKMSKAEVIGGITNLFRLRFRR